MLRVVFTLVIGLSLVANAAGAEEGPAEAARVRKLSDKATREYNLGHFQAALDVFEEAYRAKPDPVFLFDIGQCQRQMGHPKEAAYAYRRYLGAAPDAPNRPEVEKLIVTADEEVARRQAQTSPVEVRPPREVTPSAPEIAAPQSTPAAERPPLYRRWWLWTAVGAVVVAGVGVGLGVAYGGPHDADLGSAALFGNKLLEFH